MLAYSTARREDDGGGSGGDPVRRGGVWRVALRELHRALRSPLQVALMAVLPIVTVAWLLAVFREPTPRDLPVALLDFDRSPIARELARAVDATPSVRITQDVESIDEGRHLVQQGRVYALLVLPRGIEADIARGRPVHLTTFYNAQLMLASSIVARDLQAVGLLSSAGVKARMAAARGVPPSLIVPAIEPLRAQSHLLFNPQLDYRYYLLAALLPAMLQMLVAMTTVVAFGREFKEGAVDDWLRVASGAVWKAVAGKTLALALWFALIGLGLLGLLFGGVGAPLRGSPPALVIGLLLVIGAYISISVCFLALTANLRLAASLVAFYTGMAFAFMGVTFPMLALPGVARAWAELMPVTHFARVLFEQTLRGGGAWDSRWSLMALAAFCLAPWVAAAWPLSRLMRGDRRWSAR